VAAGGEPRFYKRSHSTAQARESALEVEEDFAGAAFAGGGGEGGVDFSKGKCRGHGDVERAVAHHAGEEIENAGALGGRRVGEPAPQPEAAE